MQLENISNNKNEPLTFVLIKVTVNKIKKKQKNDTIASDQIFGFHFVFQIKWSYKRNLLRHAFMFTS